MNDHFFQFQITGIVQGVGFRPWFYQEAKKKNLKGFIKNTGSGVEIVANEKKVVEEILESPPVLARITSISNKQLTINNKTYTDFSIEFSEDLPLKGGIEGVQKNAQIPPDTCICKECLRELFDPKNRRHGYFFISCTNCGPRYSITKGVPFDRENTAMGDFPLCSDCEREYRDPENRRFHAQTIACSKCGPALSFFEGGKKFLGNPLRRCIELLQKNEILSIKGIGGFSLVCTANAENTTKLRELLRRPKKPFAILCKDISQIRKFCDITPVEKKELESSARPIVLCRKKNSKTLNEISENDRLGILLPYTALHYLFFAEINTPLLFTSANMPGEPIPIRREEQNWKYILDYDREITHFSDDSVVKVIEEKPLFIRRSRGFAPKTIPIPSHFQNFAGDILAVGAEMKNTFCLKKGNDLIISPYLGNTSSLGNFENFQKTLERLLEYTGANPEIILCDQNPNFETSRFAEDFVKKKKVPLVRVQHHLAHIFSVALEKNLQDFVGIAADGVGWGADEKAWGGEVFSVGNVGTENFQSIQRIGHLEYQKLVGGDIANKEPVRFLIGILEKFMSVEEIQKILCREWSRPFLTNDISLFYQQAEQNFNCIETSSCGRILDAAAILLGLGEKNHYEGYLAEMLESCANDFGGNGRDHSLYLEPIIEKQNGQYILKTTEMFQFLVKNLEKTSSSELAHFALLYLSEGLYQLAINNKQFTMDDKQFPVVFSGGCAYSSVMTKFFLSKGVQINENIPAGDGGISAGQIAFFLHQCTNNQSLKTS